VARYRLSRSEFEELVEDALASLPKRFADLVENVVIAVEDEPNDEDLETLEDPDAEELFGIYRGVALTERSHDTEPFLPDEIAIFRGPIERASSSREEVMAEIRETVVHELGHYFGLADHEMPF